MIERAQSHHLKEIVKLTEEYYKVSPYYQRLPFEPDRCLDYLRREMILGTSFFAVYTYAGRVEGYAVAYLFDYMFCRQQCVNIEYLYIRPEYRPNHAAEEMIKYIEDWAITVGAKEIVAGDIGIDPERLARWYRTKGYTYQGVTVTKRLS